MDSALNRHLEYPPGVWIRTEKEYLVIGKGSGGTGKRI